MDEKAKIARVDVGPDTVYWGYFDARLTPVLTVDSGERVVISTVSGSPELLPPEPFLIPAALPAIHGAQGDGEVCVTAAETGLVGTFRLTVRDDLRLEWPLAEAPTHMITMAFDPDLDDCVVIAVRQMLDLVCKHTGIDRYQAYTLLSLAGDLRVTQVVNGNKGIHLMLEKRYLDPLN